MAKVVSMVDVRPFKKSANPQVPLWISKRFISKANLNSGHALLGVFRFFFVPLSEVSYIFITASQTRLDTFPLT